MATFAQKANPARNMVPEINKQVPLLIFEKKPGIVRDFIPEKYNPKSFSLPVTAPGVLNFPLPLTESTINFVRRTNVSKNQIYLIHADELSFDQFIGPDYQVFKGDVQFSHEGALMFCDSAHLYQASNSLFAFGNVHMEQGDTLFLYGAWMFYDGFSKLAKVRENVRLENNGATLFTDSLNFDRVTNIGYFFDGGLLVDSTNELSSQYGQYSTDTKHAEFKNDVKLTNPNFVLTTKQLNYNTETKIADIVSPTEIVSDSGYIYSTEGWYNTITDESRLLNRSYAISDKKRLTADTLFYNSTKGIGEGFGGVILEDSTSQITLKGDYGYNDEVKDSALLTKNALFIDHSTEDTLYLHADTLISYKITIFGTPKNIVDSLKNDSVKLEKSVKLPKSIIAKNETDSFQLDSINIKDKKSLTVLDSLQSDSIKINDQMTLSSLDSLQVDSIGIKSKDNKTLSELNLITIGKDSIKSGKESIKIVKDSVFSAIKAFKGVRFYRKDIQGICDTLNYSDRDSVMNMINEPVIWAEKQQLSGESMKLYTYNSKPKMLHVINSAIAVAYEVDSFYNQLSGKELKAFFDSSEVVRVELDGNAEAIFLPRDDKDVIMGFNRMEGSSMTIFRKDGKMEKMILWPQPKGKFYPLGKLDPQAKFLRNFEWLEPQRPKNPDDVLSVTPDIRHKSKTTKTKTSSATSTKSLTSDMP